MCSRCHRMAAPGRADGTASGRSVAWRRGRRAGRLQQTSWASADDHPSVLLGSATIILQRWGHDIATGEVTQPIEPAGRYEWPAILRQLRRNDDPPVPSAVSSRQQGITGDHFARTSPYGGRRPARRSVDKLARFSRTGPSAVDVHPMHLIRHHRESERPQGHQPCWEVWPA